jgi:uncharacterized membrane protein YphA (DoxX/SURF4 family)
VLTFVPVVVRYSVDAIHPVRLTRGDRVMNIALWVLQVVVGAFFVYHMTLLLRPNPERLRQRMKWMLEMPSALRVFAGVAEGLAGIALIFAGLIEPIDWLVPMAAAGLVLLMIGAIVFHLSRREYPNIALNAVLLLLSALIAYGRFVVQRFDA